MLQKIRQNSDFILYLALIFILVPVGTYLWRRQINTYAQAILVIGIVALFVYIYLEHARILGILTGRQARYGGNVFLMSLLFIGIIGVVDFMSTRYSKRIDLTANKTHSISEQSKKVLDNLDRPVKINAFYIPGGSATANVETLLKSYADSGRGKLSYEFIDPDAKPALARQYGLLEGENDVMVLESNDRRQKISGGSESDITNAILKLSQDTPKTVYLLAGHGEHTPDDTGQGGILMARQALEQDNYTVKTLNLSIGPTSTITSTQGITLPGALPDTGRAVGKIPQDASVLIVDAPTTSIPEAEWKVISEWLNNGGKLFLMMDALSGPSGLEDMLAVNWGIKIRNDIVVDLQGAYSGDPSALVIMQGEFSPITKDLRSQIVMPGTRSMDVPANSSDITYTPVAMSTEQSWGESDVSSANVSFDPNKDVRGPVVVAVTAERAAPGGAKSRVAVYGNARFSTDRWLQVGANTEFFVNAVNWLAEDEQLISIRPRQTNQAALFVPPSEASLLTVLSVVGLPLLVLLFGGLVWWRRR